MTTRSMFAVLFLLTGCGGSGDGGGGGGSTPERVQARTEPGAPTGAAVHATIGAAGGDVASSDGRITVRIPAGALASDVDVSVQPISNLAPGAKGAAFRLEPSGIEFAAPVTIEFRYEDADLEGTAAEALYVSFQDEQGRWWLQGGPEVDPAAKTVRVATSHFSDWSLLAGWSLDPMRAEVKVRRNRALRVVFCGEPTKEEDKVLAVYVCSPAADDVLDRVDDWRVNGVPGGTEETGTITATGDSEAVYKAPAAPPASNPVAVSALLGSSLGKVMLVSNLEVVDEACGEVGGSSVPCGWTGNTTYEARDGATGSFHRVTANSTWRFDGWDPNQPGLARYVPASGQATVVEFNFFFCTVDVSPPTHSIGDPSADALRTLAIDYDVSPPRMLTLRGQTNWQVTETLSGGEECLTPGTMEEEGTFQWVDEGGEESEVKNGAFSGHYRFEFGPDQFVDSTWSFSATK